MKKLKNLWIKIVKLLGWKFILPEKGTIPELESCVFVVAPHTSWLDFVVGAPYLWSCCSNGKVFIKKEFFRWPLGKLLRGLGGISVDCGNRHNDMVGTVVRKFAEGGPFSIAITPEWTRKGTRGWKRGPWLIAHLAGKPMVIAYIDYKKKEIGIWAVIWPSDDYEADLKKIRSFYHKEMAKHPDCFIES